LPSVAGFWIRLLAQILDGLGWAFVTSLFGWALVYFAPDMFGMANTFPHFKSCRQLSAIPPDIQPPRDLFPNVALHCSKSFFGLDFRDEIVLAEVQRQGNITSTKTMSYAVGRDLRPKDVFDLDGVFWLGFIVYGVVAQAFDGATFGKRALRLRVIGSDGGPPGLRAALVRNLILWGPGLAIAAVLIAFSVSGAFFANIEWIYFLCVVLGLATLALVGQIWWTASRGTQASMTGPQEHGSYACLGSMRSRRMRQG
jgi:uncharacterized RDD family membrane protein YckC